MIRKPKQGFDWLGNGLACPFNLDRFGNLPDVSGNPSCGMLTGKQINAQNPIAPAKAGCACPSGTGLPDGVKAASAPSLESRSMSA